jgi:hypothetical protein
MLHSGHADPLPRTVESGREAGAPQGAQVLDRDAGLILSVGLPKLLLPTAGQLAITPAKWIVFHGTGNKLYESRFSARLLKRRTPLAFQLSSEIIA